MPSSWIRATTRIRIYARDRYRCVYCGRSVRASSAPTDSRAATLDHVLPREAGGSNHPSNVVTCCLSCNSSKQEMELNRWMTSKGLTDDEKRQVRHQVKLAVKRQLPPASSVAGS